MSLVERYTDFVFWERNGNHIIQCFDQIDDSIIRIEVSRIQLLRFLSDERDCDFSDVQKWYSEASDESIFNLLKDYLIKSHIRRMWPND